METHDKYHGFTKKDFVQAVTGCGDEHYQEVIRTIRRQAAVRGLTLEEHVCQLGVMGYRSELMEAYRHVRRIKKPLTPYSEPLRRLSDTAPEEGCGLTVETPNQQLKEASEEDLQRTYKAVQEELARRATTREVEALEGLRDNLQAVLELDIDLERDLIKDLLVGINSKLKERR